MFQFIGPYPSIIPNPPLSPVLYGLPLSLSINFTLFHASSVEFELLPHPFVHLPVRKQGEYTWSLLYSKDKSGDEFTCFGVTTLPVDASKYDRNHCMWLVRCYNGSRYKFGSEITGRVPAIHPGTLLHFKLDMDAKTLTMRIGDGEPLLLFEDVVGTVCVCVCVCSSVFVLSFSPHASAVRSAIHLVVVPQWDCRVSVAFVYSRPFCILRMHDMLLFPSARTSQI